uniref:hypothetical protein n=1 Tax=Actinoplanes sp. RD1 TaxID=3064538 RepID=UPI002741AD39|nr:hypothetical protein [Actinoplanes sp. RD1]
MLTVVNPEEPTPAAVAEPAASGGSFIDEMVRDGARRILAAAWEAEVAACIAAHAGELATFVAVRGLRVQHRDRRLRVTSPAVPTRSRNRSCTRS